MNLQKIFARHILTPDVWPRISPNDTQQKRMLGNVRSVEGHRKKHFSRVAQMSRAKELVDCRNSAGDGRRPAPLLICEFITRIARIKEKPWLRTSTSRLIFRLRQDSVYNLRLRMYDIPPRTLTAEDARHPALRRSCENDFTRLSTQKQTHD